MYGGNVEIIALNELYEVSIGEMLYLRTKLLNWYGSSSCGETTSILFFNGCHYNVLLSVEEKERLDSFGGLAIAEAVSRRLPTAAALLRSQVRWDLWCTKWHWGRFSPSTSVSPANSHSTDRSTLIIYHPGLVQ
jgi:hypothetical protein